MLPAKLRALICLLLLYTCTHTVYGQPKTGKVQPYNGRPTIFVNDKPMAPVFYALTHAYTGRWSWEENPQRQLRLFCETGIRLFQLDLYFEDIWFKEKDSLDMTKALKQVQGLLEVCPDANLVLRVHVNAPFWWNDEHPEELTKYVDGEMDTRDYGPPFDTESGDTERPRRASLASLKYRALAVEKLAEFCRRLAASPEGNAVIGIHVAGGVFGEWHYWGFPFHEGDSSAPMTEVFRQWLRRKYKTDDALAKAWNSNRFRLSTATVPDTTERMFTTHGIFRNPAKERRVIDYFNCQQEVVADDIELYAKTVKENWPRPVIVGIFYGYFHTTFSRQAVGGHMYIERILNSPYIDYLSAPQSYYGLASESGGSGHSRGVIESARLHNKLFLDEVDNGKMQDQKYFQAGVKDRADPKYLPMIRRSALMPLSRGMGFWYYDFGPRRTAGFWDSKIYHQNFRQELEFFEAHKNKPFVEAADVLMVWDMESLFYVYNNKTPVSDDMIDKTAGEIYKTGAAVDHIYLFDLDRINPDKYKAIIFMNVFTMTASQRKFVNEKLAGKGRTLIWNYMPGITNGDQYDASWPSKLTGIRTVPFASPDTPSVVTRNSDYPTVAYFFRGKIKPLSVIADPDAIPIAYLSGTDNVVIASKKFKNYTGVYGTLPIHDPALLQSILKKAGVHIYNDVSNEVTVASDDLVWIYTLTGGRRTLVLKNGMRIALDLPKNSVTLFNADTGVVIF